MNPWQKNPLDDGDPNDLQAQLTTHPAMRRDEYERQLRHLQFKALMLAVLSATAELHAVLYEATGKVRGTPDGSNR